MVPVVLASQSTIRAELLRRVGVAFETRAAHVDEVSIRQAMDMDGAAPRDIADKLAEFKSLKVSGKEPQSLVIGSDQVLALDGRLFEKPTTPEAAVEHLRLLRGGTHELFSAAVISQAGQPQWRTIATARLAMKPLSDAFIDGYVKRNWPSIGDSVGAYKLEEEGPRLFHKISGDHFTVLGLPLLPLCAYLETRGVLSDG
ncbi:MAG: nucleoside triphosphate pyrophosphatase [Pseudomonadota bacterium]